MKRTVVLLTAIFLLMLLSACGLGEGEPVRIGLIAYLKGDGMTIASSGSPSLNGAQLAVEQINARGGLRIGNQSHPVELIIASIENDSEQAVAATRRLVEEEGVVAIVGPQYSGDAIAAGELADQLQIPMISGTSTNPRTTENRKFVFRATFTDTAQASVLARFAYNDLRARRVAIMYDLTDTYSSDLALFFAQNFTAQGGTIVTNESFESGNWRMEEQFQRIIATEPDLVFLPVYPAEAIYQAGTLRKMGYEGLFLGSDGWDALALVNLPAFQGSYASTTYSATVTTPVNQAFIREYQAAFNALPLDAAGLTYDAFNLIFAAIERMQSFDPVAIRDGLYALPLYTGVAGPIDFTNSGDPVKPINMLFFDRGTLSFYKAVQP